MPINANESTSTTKNKEINNKRTPATKNKKTNNKRTSKGKKTKRKVRKKIILEVKNLGNNFKKTNILKEISFEILEGSFHGFVGENGAGKTTTMCFIAGVLNDYYGEIKFENINIKELEEKSILFIPERVEFPNHLSAFKFVKVFSEIFTNKEIPNKEIDELFALFDISEVKDRKASKLSSGQKKKISLIRTILSKPKLLLIDEPAANLDPTSRFKLFNALKMLNKQGTTILMSSHIISELEKYVDSATLIKKGQIIWTGTLDGKLSDVFENSLLKGGF